MVTAATKTERLSREDWIQGALELLSVAGVDGVRIVPLAERLGVTSGSFYWHFKNRGELYDALVQYWERELTDAAIDATQSIEPPEERIWQLMNQVMTRGLARYDLAIWHWAQSDKTAKKVFRRAVNNRFAYAKWMFEQVGFSAIQAETRGRMMVVYMMGESTLITDSVSVRRKRLRLKYEILLSK